MIALLQRVARASVEIKGETVAAIDAGLLVLVGIEQDDDAGKVERLLHKLLDYRVFADTQGRMNRSLRDVDGGLLLVPQFTLVADTDKGLRPSFSRGAAPDHAQRLFEQLVSLACCEYGRVGCGRFGADMQVALVNDGPVTFQIRV